MNLSLTLLSPEVFSQETTNKMEDTKSERELVRGHFKETDKDSHKNGSLSHKNRVIWVLEKLEVSKPSFSC